MDDNVNLLVFALLFLVLFPKSSTGQTINRVPYASSVRGKDFIAAVNSLRIHKSGLKRTKIYNISLGEESPQDTSLQNDYYHFKSGFMKSYKVGKFPARKRSMSIPNIKQ